MAAEAGNVRSSFIDRLGFEPDGFQLDAFDSVDRGENVVVAAPTGAGKTLVAAYAVAQAIDQGQRIFYTTPIKALSNQKFHDLVAEHGLANVGLLTGDNNINGDAPVVVMTTEVLRNMLYARSSLDRLQTVVLDEVHYLQDAYRGPVWEEVIIHLPRRIQLVCLSATVSNADELARWIETVRGATGLVVETERPVELTNFYMVGERDGSHLHMLRTVQGRRPNPKGFRFDIDPRDQGNRKGGGRGGGRGRNQRGRPRRKWRTPNRVDVIEMLDRRDLLPAINFIFSRAGCDDAVRAVVGRGISLTTAEERERIRTIVAEHTRVLDRVDLEVLDFYEFRKALEAGVAAHHAGMVPPFKEAVEACFVEGLVKAVFATETLALGINMPARTVVLEKLSKFTGEQHEFLTPAQYTQLTGRAGRRGIDSHGTAVVLWSPFVPFEQVSGLATSRKFVLSSSFRPTYNMAANLVRRYQPERARQLLNLSFAQYRADSGVVESEHRIERLIERRGQVLARLERDFGPLEELRAAARTPEVADVDLQAVTFAMSNINPGDVLELVSPDSPTPVAVLAVAFRKGGKIKMRVTDREGETYELTPAQLEAPPFVVGSVELPEPYLPNSVTFAYEVGQALSRTRLVSKKRRKSLAPSGVVVNEVELPPDATKGLKRLDKIDRDLERLRSSAGRRAESLAGQFDRVIALLEKRGHLDGWELTPSGERLARLYHESDLLLVEAIDEELFDDLNPAQLVAFASTFVYEERRGSGHPPEPWYPTGDLRRRFRRLQARHVHLAHDEDDHRLPLTRPPDAGFMAVAHGWAAGGGLDEVLADEEFTPGDFVRTAKQLIDLLRQLAKLAPVPATADAARAGAEAMHRDVVAASSLVGVLPGQDGPESDESESEPDESESESGDDGDESESDESETGDDGDESESGTAPDGGDETDAEHAEADEERF